MHLVNSIVEVGTAAAVCALVLSDSGFISALARLYQHPSGFCSAPAAKAARALAAGQQLRADYLQAKYFTLVFSR